MNEADCEPIFIITPWRRALFKMEEGKLDLIMNLSITEERKNYMLYIGPQRDESVILVVRKESDFKINTLNDFKNLPKPVAMVRGSFYGKSFDSKFKCDSSFAKKIYLANGTEQLVSMLNAKRISGYIRQKAKGKFEKVLERYR
jgi:polar amino acid transport system substrate-binding protein